MKLLIIEDDINLAATLARRLTKYGFNCEIAHNHTDALLKARQQQPDCILLDMKLADENGLSLIAPLRHLLTHAHIVLLTSRSAQEDREIGKEMGADAYLTKPVDMEELLNKISQLLVSTTVTEISEGVMSPERLEWEHIQHVLHSNNGNVSMTARQLNMHRRTLQRKLQKKPVQQ